MNDIGLEEPFAERLRVALHELGDHAFPNDRPARSAASAAAGLRSWSSARVLIAVASVLVVGLVSLALLARRDDHSTVTVEAPVVPLRLAPVILPSDMVAVSVQQFDRGDPAAEGQVWVRRDQAGVIQAIVSVSAPSGRLGSRRD